MIILTQNGYIIPHAYFQKKPKQLEKLKKDLHVIPIKNKDFLLDEDEFDVYEETAEYIRVPRYYGIKKFGKPKNFFYDDQSYETNMKFTGSLRPQQEEAVQTTLDSLIKKNGALLCVPCGFGKTIMAIYIACKLKVKTLILVHKGFLSNQWCERILQVTDAKIGFIKQDIVDIENKDIVIGMIQSIAMKDYHNAIFQGFGLIIVDECHRIASKVFSRSLIKAGCKYTLGVSATPNRKDGLIKVVKWYIGDMAYQITDRPNTKVNVFSINYRATVPEFRYCERYMKGSMRPDIQTMLTNLTQLYDRNTTIINSLEHLALVGRKILVLSFRREHLTELNELLTDRLTKAGISNITTGFYVGGMKEAELKLSSEATVIFATYAMAEEGLDIDSLNTLFLVLPKKDVIQSVGRILRKPASEGSVTPLVVEIADEMYPFFNWTIKRHAYYTKSEYDITNALCLNEDLISPTQLLEYKKTKFDKNLPEDVYKKYMLLQYGATYEQNIVDYDKDRLKYQWLCDFRNIKQYYDIILSDD